MDGLKSPGLDGIIPLFYQKFWGIAGSNVTSVVLSFLDSRKMLKKINFTYVSLIPK